MPKSYTIVYRINNEEAFKPEFDRIHENFMVLEDRPWVVTGISINDEMTRLDWVREAVEQGDLELAEAALNYVDICNVNSLDDLRV